jgi:hypothetical protein
VPARGQGFKVAGPGGGQRTQISGQASFEKQNIVMKGRFSANFGR